MNHFSQAADGIIDAVVSEKQFENAVARGVAHVKDGVRTLDHVAWGGFAVLTEGENLLIVENHQIPQYQWIKDKNIQYIVSCCLGYRSDATSTVTSLRLCRLALRLIRQGEINEAYRAYSVSLNVRNKEPITLEIFKKNVFARNTARSV